MALTQDPLAQSMHDAIRALLASLATGADGFGPTIPRRLLLASREIQALSDAADGWQRAQNEEPR
jgi:hypothetical protein